MRTRKCVRVRRGSGALAAWLALGVLSVGSARADAVDEAYARGSEASAREDWHAAAIAFEQARKILPIRSAQLSYDLGTAYANLGELGYATYHLKRALDAPAGIDAALAEPARRNAAIVRRRLELNAAGASLQISEPEDWRDALAVGLASSWFAWVALLLGLGGGLALLVRSSGRARAQAGALAWVAGIGFLCASGAHLLARGSDRATPPSIVLPSEVEVREGPGSHTPRGFALSGGSRVWVRETRSGWAQIQTPSGLLGWVRDGDLASLGAPAGAGAPSPKLADPVGGGSAANHPDPGLPGD